MTNKPNIYILPYYANKKNLCHNRLRTEEEYKISFSDENLSIDISEVTSLIEDRYCLSFKSAKFIIEGSVTKKEYKEAMIHHHPYSHPWKHLQFKLRGKNKVIRINLEPLDQEDYEKCIKGFLYISQKLIQQEKTKQDLTNYFFNNKINKLRHFKNYLINKIKYAYKKGKILNDLDKSLTKEQLLSLREDKKLQVFLKWN